MPRENYASTELQLKYEYFYKMSPYEKVINQKLVQRNIFLIYLNTTVQGCSKYCFFSFIVTKQFMIMFQSDTLKNPSPMHDFSPLMSPVSSHSSCPFPPKLFQWEMLFFSSLPPPKMVTESVSCISFPLLSAPSVYPE